MTMTDLRIRGPKTSLGPPSPWHFETSTKNNPTMPSQKKRKFHGLVLGPRWVFPKIGIPQNGWFGMGKPYEKWMIWGETHYFRKPSDGSHLFLLYVEKQAPGLPPPLKNNGFSPISMIKTL